MKHRRFSAILSLALSLVLSLCTLSVLGTLTASAADVTDVSDRVTAELPPLFDDCDNFFEFEDCFDQDGSGFNANTQDGGYVYYYLKGTYEESYMKFTFNLKQAGTYQLCIGLMGFPSSTPRTGELTVNGGERFYINRDYTGLPVQSAEYVSGMTVYCHEGENTIMVYLGSDFDNVNVKSLFFDNFYLVRVDKLPDGYTFPGEEIVETPMDVTGASKDVIRFNRNFRPLINSVNYCKLDYVEDPEFGEVLNIMVDREYEFTPDVSLSYTKLLRALGLDDQERICDEYEAAVIAVKADSEYTVPSLAVFCFTNGNNLRVGGTLVTEPYEADDTWQYVVMDMTYASEWYGTLLGLALSPASSVEVGASIRLGEIRLFKDYDEALNYSDVKMGYVKPEETAAETEADTAAADTAADTAAEATDAATDVPAAEATEAATAAGTTAGDETAAAEGGCASAAGAAAVLTVIAAAGFTVRKKRRA